MPRGGARNAVDCALWELEAKRDGRAGASTSPGSTQPRPLITTFTLGADDPEAMAEGARRYADAQAIKVKLTGELELDVERVAAIRAARPDVWLGVDANQGFTRDRPRRAGRGSGAQRVSLLEQPLPRGCEADLDGYRCADPDRRRRKRARPRRRPGLVGRFDVVNIKLDKCGGLTEALLIADEARRLGLGVMVGNMVGTSLAMAPGVHRRPACATSSTSTARPSSREDRTPAVRISRRRRSGAPDEVWGSRPAA